MRQKGVALITAVLIVALVTTIAVAMASRQQLDIRRSSNMFDSDQALLAALGGEDYARNVLEVDGKKSTTDNLDEDWAQPVQFPFEGMVLSGTVEDMQGRFNLNNLVDNNGNVNQEDLQRFERLLRLLDLDVAIAQGVIDWLDSDTNPRMNGGAEDDYYMQLQPGYRCANRYMASASELRLVKDVTAEVYKKLAPFVVALHSVPVRRTDININTAPAEILAILANNLTVADGESMVSARSKSGYTTVQEFLDQPIPKNSNIQANGLSVKSDYFLLNAMAELDTARTQLFSLLERQGNGVKVSMRGRGAY